MAICISCNKDNKDYVKFKCPKCNAEIVRCENCRALEIDYQCKKCDFKGI
jgi:predicted RNA-binding Zn-ribbon protein involved in translation (DUF1610 family)